MLQKVFIRNVSWRFYAKRKFCVRFEVHIPVLKKKKHKKAVEPNFPMQIPKIDQLKVDIYFDFFFLNHGGKGLKMMLDIIKFQL